MTYARARLWLGISGVGFFVTCSATALWFDLPRRLLGGVSPLRAISLTLALYILLSLPFDLLGGNILPRRYGRTNASLPHFFRSWLQGVVSQALIMGLGALFLLQAASRGGLALCIATFVLLMLCLLYGQLAVATLVGGLRPGNARPPAPSHLAGETRSFPQILVYQSTDPAFVGGLVGLPGSEQLVLPSRWLDILPAEIVTMQMTRRLGALVTGARTRGVGLALVWNLAGFALASQLPRSDLATAPGLIDTALWFTLWSFVGLLLLPSLNRPGVLEADRYAADSGIAAASMETAMVDLDRLQDDEPRRSRWIERVFHPIPSVESRMAALEPERESGSGRKGGRGGFGAWQGARVTLYLSWACLGFLSRAVHCNVGRPELWVLFPGD